MIQCGGRAAQCASYITLGFRALPKALGRNTRRATKDAVESLDASKAGSCRHAMGRQVSLKEQPFGPLQSAAYDLRKNGSTNGVKEPPLERSARNTRLFGDIRDADGLPGVIVDEAQGASDARVILRNDLS